MVKACPLKECIARPEDKKGIHPLKDHLLAVAEGCGSPVGERFERLRFLAGLLHDAGKTSKAWQDYIRGKTKKGTPHAYAGAMLFSAFFADLLEAWQPTRWEKRSLCHLAVNLTQIVYYHHGRIEDINSDFPPWTGIYSPNIILEVDLFGFIKLISPYYPECEARLNLYNKHPQFLVERITSVADSGFWPKWITEMAVWVEKALRDGNPYEVGAKFCLQMENTRLITIDRLHAGDIVIDERNQLQISQAALSLDKISQHCTSRKSEMVDQADQLILDIREKWRQRVVENFIAEDKEKIFTLELPTGYGKTMSALSVATKSVKRGSCKRIIYVAPYLSILSQNASEISQSTGLNVLTHHHLSSLQGLVEQELTEDLIMEAWQAPVVATTFNQLFLALFPTRAQNTLRLSGLKDSFVIVDEPQIISADAWNIFLCLAEATTIELGTKFLFVTATMPRTDGGVLGRVISLGRAEPISNRYQVEFGNSENEQSLAEKALHSFRTCGSTAVIMNTVRDAAGIYQLVCGHVPEKQVFFLSGRMTPLHKKERIATIKRSLESGQRALVICTQVLEAGVDLSFREIFRALPVIPSLIQAAGRCNRHGEGKTGRLFVFEFLRGGEKNTRQYVYRDADQRRATDICLIENKVFDELEATHLVRQYYDLCFQQNTRQAILEKILEGAQGYYASPAGLSPFGKHIPQYSIFVPLFFGELPLEVKIAMEKYGCQEPSDIWGKYCSKKFLPSLKYTEKKQFMGLMQHFIVQVPEETAKNIGMQIEDKAILRIRSKKFYSDKTGLSLITADDEKELWFM